MWGGWFLVIGNEHPAATRSNMVMWGQSYRENTLCDKHWFLFEFPVNQRKIPELKIQCEAWIKRKTQCFWRFWILLRRLLESVFDAQSNSVDRESAQRWIIFLKIVVSQGISLELFWELSAYSHTDRPLVSFQNCLPGWPRSHRVLTSWPPTAGASCRRSTSA